MALQVRNGGLGTRQAWSVDGACFGHQESSSCAPARLQLTYTRSVTSSIPTFAVTTRYAYDPLYRLTNANSSGAYTCTFGYAYDAVGNRTAQTATITSTQVTSYQYDAANRLTSVNGQPYTWDNNGSLTNNGKFAFTYNNAGRMTQAQGLTATQVYTYNGEGLLMNRNDARYVWDQAADLPQLLSDGNTLYVPGVGQWNGSAWAYDLADGLGSVRQLVDAQGNVVQSYTYSPFGELIAAQGNRSSALRYTGEQSDDDTGLVYLRARWYDPSTGRFTTRDPFQGLAGYPQTQHAYVYSLNNPINVTDPSGEFVETPWDVLMVGLDLLFLGFDYLYYDLLNPCLDRNQRNIAINTDWSVLAFDLAMVATPGGPAGAGLLTRVFGRGTVALAETVVHASPVIRVGQSVVKGVQAGTHLAEASGGSGESRKPQPLKGKEATKAADEVGYTQRIPPQKVPFDSHGQPAFRNPKTGTYITPDIDSHTGGVWKMFGRKGNRLGTYNADLTVRIGN